MKKCILLATCIVISFSACKKSGNNSAPSPIPPVNNTGCLLASHSVVGGPFEGNTVYDYDEHGQMTGFEFYNNTYGVYPARKDTIFYSAPGVISYVSAEFGSGSDYHVPDLNTMEYADPPDQETISYKKGGDYRPGENPNSPVTLFKYRLWYDDKERLVQVTEDIANTKMDIYYNDENNVVRMVIEPLTGPRGITTITVSAYDAKPNPYSNIPYWKFVRPDYWINAYDEESLLTALSRNNPMDFTLNATYIGSPTYIFSRVMTYTYNDKGLPVSRTSVQNQTGQAEPSTYAETFQYTCK